MSPETDREILEKFGKTRKGLIRSRCEEEVNISSRKTGVLETYVTKETDLKRREENGTKR